MKILNTKKAIKAVENNTKKIFSDFKLNLRYNENISLCSLKARYPQSRDDILVKTLTGKDIDKINTVILSPETLCNIFDCLLYPSHLQIQFLSELQILSLQYKFSFINTPVENTL